MEVGSPEWIEASLARLDELERERAQHEAALETVEDPAALKRHTEAFTRLDTEIKSLYAQLEAVADDDDDDEGDDESAVNEVEASVPRATQGDDELSAPHFSAMATPAPVPHSNPVAKPIVRGSDNPFGSSPSPSPSGGGGFDAVASMPMGDDDVKPAGGGAKWAFLGVVLLAGIGVGSYFIWQDMQSKKPAADPASAEPEKVIRAAGVPDDTEAPPTAPSGHATISPNASPTTEAGKKKKKDDEDKPNPLKLKGDGGPL